jgi:two-component system, sporulation sensor kinase D
MKRKQKKSIVLYIMIVLLPTLLGSTYFINERTNNRLNERIEEAKWVASIHESHWDKFISGTVTSLEMLSLTARTLYDDIGKMQPLLEKAHQSDPRYGGLYFISKDGSIISGSNKYVHKSTFIEENLVDEVIRTKDIIISNKQFTLLNGQKVIALAAPVMNENGDIIAVTMALLRIDYVENLLRVLTPDAKLVVLNANDETFIEFNISDEEQLDKDNWVVLPIERLPWKIKVKVPEEEISKFSIDSILVIATFLVLTHILYLGIIYLLLKRQAAMEKKENEAQKLELVGTLAASTAHEIRNPLTGIKGLVQLLSEKYDDSQDQFYFSVINEEIERINEIVSEFLILGKPTAQIMETVDLTRVLKELHPLILSDATFNQINLHCDVPVSPIFVKCTKDQIKQVILNITRNAFEAMEEGGNLSILLEEKNNRCELTITDNGVGMKEEMMEKIFTPFYTSKETGTGLGLVICRRILQSFGGEIQITSKEHKGTKVVISLPLQSTL